MLEQVEQVNSSGGEVEGVDTIVLNTKRRCFLCLKNISFFRQNDSIEIGGKQCSLHNICRHLNIKFDGKLIKDQLVGASEIVQFLNVQREGVEEDGKISNIAVKLCQECHTVVSKLSDMCMELELLQRKVKCCLCDFYQVLETSSSEEETETGDSDDKLIIDLAPDDGGFHDHGKLAKTIRNEIKGKCSKKLDHVSPEEMLAEEKDEKPDSLKNEVSTSPKIVSTFTQSVPSTTVVPQFSIQQLAPAGTFVPPPPPPTTTTTATILLPSTPIFFFNNDTSTMQFLQPIHNGQAQDTQKATFPEIIPAAAAALTKTVYSSSRRRISKSRTFKCTTCFESFSNRNTLMRHLRFLHPQKEEGQKNRNCSLCNIKFRYKTDFDKHVKYECQHRSGANAVEVNPSLNPSVEEGKSKKQFICKLCNPHLTMGTRRGFKEHTVRNHVETLLTDYKMPHLSMREFKEYCDHVFQLEVLSSVKGHNAEGNPCVQCSHCSNSYSNHYTLRQHLYVVHEEIISEKLIKLQRTSTLEDIMAIDLPTFSFPANERWTCVACGATFAQDTTLYKHRRHNCKYRHENNTLLCNDLKCEICGKEFPSAQSKTIHRRKAHGNVPPIGMNVQFPEFGIEENAAADVDIPMVDITVDSEDETALDEEDISCSMIPEANDLSFTTSADSTNNESIHTCTLCHPHCLIQEEDLKRHQIENHVETLFDDSCKLPNVSMKEFKMYCNHVLKMDMLASKKEYNELGNPVFYCSHCSKRYASQRGLSLHTFSEHKQLLSTKLVELQQKFTATQIKSMDILASSYATENDINLKKHQSQNKPLPGSAKPNHSTFKCDICSKIFNQRGSLWIHKKRSHFSKIQVTGIQTLANSMEETTTTEEGATGMEVPSYRLQLNYRIHDFVDETEYDDDDEEQSQSNSPQGQEYLLVEENSSTTIYSEDDCGDEEFLEMIMEVPDDSLL